VKSKIVGSVALVAAAVAALWWALPKEDPSVKIIDGAVVGLEFVGATSPGLSSTDRARLYYDTTADTVQISSNGGAFATLGPFVGGTLTSQLVFSAITTDIITGTDEDLNITPNGTGTVFINKPLRVVATTNNNVEVCIASASCGGLGTNTRFFISNSESTQGATMGINNGNAARLSFKVNGTTHQATGTLGGGGGSTAGDNFSLTSGANAAGEFAITLGTNDTATGETLVRMATDIDGTSVTKFLFNGDGHITVTGTAPSSYTTGTCTNETGTGDDTSGTVTADCTAQTLIVTFGGTYTTAPVCVVSAMNAAASAGAATMTYTVSTTVLTMTVTPATAAGTWAINCIE
jgi:hypothetical protein